MKKLPINIGRIPEFTLLHEITLSADIIILTQCKVNPECLVVIDDYEINYYLGAWLQD